MLTSLDPWFIENLVCPVSKTALVFSKGVLRASDGFEYPVVDGIPVMLREDWDSTLWVSKSSLSLAREGLENSSDMALESLGISDCEREELRSRLRHNDFFSVDPVVSYLVAATNGIMYKPLVGQLDRYPIPDFRLPSVKDRQRSNFLDLGCSWGRWCIAARRKGYQTTGIDPSLGAVMAARRVTQQLGLSARYLVGDARFLPFREDSFDVVFSYSVFQHLGYAHVIESLKEAKRILKKEGYCFVQMPNKFGIRCLYHQLKRGFREPVDFEVRYWSLGQLKETFSKVVGPVTMSVDCFFGLGIQRSDLSLMTLFKKIVILCSDLLTRISHVFTPMIFWADSIYVKSARGSQ